MAEGASPWVFACWLRNCCRDAPEQLGIDETTMALYGVNQVIELLDGILAKGRRTPGLKMALWQLLEAKQQLIIEVSEVKDGQ